MNNATLAQGNQVQTLILQKKLSVRALQNLLASGLLSKLLDAANAGTIDKVSPFDFIQLLGLGSEDTVFYDEPVKAKVDYCSSHPELPGTGIDFEVFSDSALEDTVGQSDPTLCLIQVDRGCVPSVKEVLVKRKFRGANRRDLVAFLKATSNNLLEYGFTGRIILAGSIKKNPNDMEKYCYWPFIRLNQGMIEECGMIRGDDCTNNGNANVSYLGVRDYFLVGI